MTRTAATTTEQNVVERQLAIESSLATTNNCNQLLLERKSQTLLHFCPVITSIGALSLSLSYSLALGLCACEWQTFCTIATKRTDSKAEQAEKEKAKESEQGSRI